MNTIKKQTGLSHPSLKGVTIFPTGKKPQAGTPQKVIVHMDAGAIIPMHSHKSNARMIICSGSATVLSNDNTNGTPVSAGDIVDFLSENEHGFVAGENGMTFLSDNDGIVDADGRWDMKLAS